MTHYGTLNEYRFEGREADDIRGAKVYGLEDEKLGKIDDVVFDHSSGAIEYVVVDTGGWLSSRKFLVPTERLRPSMQHEGDFETTLDKQRIQDFPPYSEKDLQSNDTWDRYTERFKQMWTDNPVQHRKGTDHDVTPTAGELPPVPPSDVDIDVDYDPDVVNRRLIPSTGDVVVIPVSASGIGDRWSNFEQLLRERHYDVTGGCDTCNKKSARTDGTEMEQERKAS
jgi:sporulation protein YlmC with PRC-barrel domain